MSFGPNCPNFADKAVQLTCDLMDEKRKVRSLETKLAVAIETLRSIELCCDGNVRYLAEQALEKIEAIE